MHNRTVTAGRFGAALWVALGAALVANALDAATTWLGLTWFHGREVGVLAWFVVRKWGLAAALVLLKGTGVLLILGIAAVGTEGEARWWRAKPRQRWVAVIGLWLVAAWFGYLAFRNAIGIWTVYEITKQ